MIELLDLSLEKCDLALVFDDLVFAFVSLLDGLIDLHSKDSLSLVELLVYRFQSVNVVSALAVQLASQTFTEGLRFISLAQLCFKVSFELVDLDGLTSEVLILLGDLPFKSFVETLKVDKIDEVCLLSFALALLGLLFRAVSQTLADLLPQGIKFLAELQILGPQVLVVILKAFVLKLEVCFLQTCLIDLVLEAPYNGLQIVYLVHPSEFEILAELGEILNGLLIFFPLYY